jgi:steroid delta-isomerase-like uncharacterized protein
MSTKKNKALVRRYYEEVFNEKHLASIGEFLAPNLVDHNLPPGVPAGIEGTKQVLAMYLTAFPDLHFTIEDMIAKRDKVVSRITATGTQQGAFMGIPPTGKHVTVTLIEIIRIADGKGVEIWLNMDTLGLMQQLGVIPALGQAS